MKTAKWLMVLLVLVLASLPASSQQMPAPDITGTSVQGMAVDLGAFKGDKNVVVVFYRMHS